MITRLHFPTVAAGTFPEHLHVRSSTIPNPAVLQDLIERTNRATEKIATEREQFGRKGFGRQIRAAVRQRITGRQAPRVEASASASNPPPSESFGQKVAGAVKAKQAARYREPPVQPLTEAETKRRFVLASAADARIKRSLRWQCKACGHVQHFEERVSVAVAGKCPRCKGTEFKPAA